jgi:CDP-diacylglycerol--glycerol-3-phosphate 3-phosphatidyltransferase
VLFAGVLPAAILAASHHRQLYWLAAGLFLVSAALDVVDGAVARRLNSETEFGGRFDTEMDGLLVGIGTVGVVIDGTVPVAFLAVGGARYCFVAAGYLRRRRGLSCADLEPRFRRKLNGGVVTATVLLAVFPPTSGPASWWIASIVTPVTVGFFIWDWLAVAGHRE